MEEQPDVSRERFHQMLRVQRKLSAILFTHRMNDGPRSSEDLRRKEKLIDKQINTLIDQNESKRWRYQHNVFDVLCHNAVQFPLCFPCFYLTILCFVVWDPCLSSFLLIYLVNSIDEATLWWRATTPSAISKLFTKKIYSRYINIGIGFHSTTTSVLLISRENRRK